MTTLHVLVLATFLLALEVPIAFVTGVVVTLFVVVRTLAVEEHDG